MLNSLKSWIYYIFPKRCAVCGGVIPFDEVFCEECYGKLESIDEKTCIRCGLPSKKCECKRYAYHFRGITAPFENEGVAKEGIYNFKILKNIDASESFGKKMADKVREVFGDIDFDIVTAVPMSRRKRKGTVFDHTEILAKAVARELDLKYKKLLVKKKQNKEQHTLSATDRFENVKGVYIAGANDYRNVLLVDDIKTTGATTDECARQLMLAGAENVYCVTAVIGT